MIVERMVRAACRTTGRTSRDTVPCSSICIATVSSSDCPPLVAETSDSAFGSDTTSGADATPSATSRTARCATALPR